MLKKNQIHIYVKFLLIVIFSCVLLSCQYIYNKWPHELSKLSSDPAIVYGKLQNGFKHSQEYMQYKYSEN